MIRTIGELAHNNTAYGSRGRIRPEYRFVGLHLQRLREHEHSISHGVEQSGLTDYGTPQRDVSSKAMTVFYWDSRQRFDQGRTHFTSPVTVRWSSSTIFGIVLNRFWKLAIYHASTISHKSRTIAYESRTFLKWSPNLMTGVVSNIRASFSTS